MGRPNTILPGDRARAPRPGPAPLCPLAAPGGVAAAAAAWDGRLGSARSTRPAQLGPAQPGHAAELPAAPGPLPGAAAPAARPWVPRRGGGGRRVASRRELRGLPGRAPGMAGRGAGRGWEGRAGRGAGRGPGGPGGGAAAAMGAPLPQGTMDVTGACYCTGPVLRSRSYSRSRRAPATLLESPGLCFCGLSLPLPCEINVAWGSRLPRDGYFCTFRSVCRLLLHFRPVDTLQVRWKRGLRTVENGAR